MKVIRLLCLPQIRLELLAWYDANHRILPWRRNAHSKRDLTPADKYQPVPMNTPQQQFLYFVWVCEVMSQQTQVPRVAEYFTKWILKWPTVQVGASATTAKACMQNHISSTVFSTNACTDMTPAYQAASTNSRLDTCLLGMRSNCMGPLAGPSSSQSGAGE